MSSLHRGHANLLCIVPILTDDPRRESDGFVSLNGLRRVQMLAFRKAAATPPGSRKSVLSCGRLALAARTSCLFFAHGIRIRHLQCHRHCVRAVKEMDSKSIGLCPQGFESPRCRFTEIVGFPPAIPVPKHPSEIRMPALEAWRNSCRRRGCAQVTPERRN